MATKAPTALAALLASEPASDFDAIREAYELCKMERAAFEETVFRPLEEKAATFQHAAFAELNATARTVILMGGHTLTQISKIVVPGYAEALSRRTELHDAESIALGVLFCVPAPDAAALKLKLELAAETGLPLDADCIETKAILADANRLLSGEA